MSCPYEDELDDYEAAAAPRRSRKPVYVYRPADDDEQEDEDLDILLGLPTRFVAKWRRELAEE
jgi:hypothetical protein